MIKVYKYWIKGVYYKYDFDIPVGAKIVDVGNLDDHIVFWALVDTDKSEEKRGFIAVTTGSKIDDIPIDKLHPIGTCVTSQGAAIHIFEVK